MNSRRLSIISLVILWALSSASLCQSKHPNDTVKAMRERPHELCGFLLRQSPKAFSSALGAPFQEVKTDDGRVARAYHLPGSKGSYLVAYFSAKPGDYAHDHATEMELTGDDFTGTTGFFGLKLGDSAERVKAALGAPTEIRHEDDTDLDLWNYKESNYTLEFTKAQRLYSIQIIDEQGASVPGFAGGPEVRRFGMAIQNADIDKIMEMSSGEIECTRKQAFGIQNGVARIQLADPKSDVSQCLKAAAEEILTFGPEMKGTDDQIRLWEGHSPGTVTKFPAISRLKEVVFDQEAGAFRVYEVTFR
jgi:hypothetical protein